MKTGLFCLAAIVLLAFTTQVPSLKNTRWSAMGFAMHFTSGDTVKIYVDNELLAEAIYSVKDSVLTWRDARVSEMSCDTTITGTYIYSVKNDILGFKPVKDDCRDRATSLSRIELVREK
ncbi:MAG: hypothetical protein EOO05_03070 [Chitinophagaceae bacterium]|nr:MAG: hypothetical protein EOO05_03070 [Chitinophagaceae bacterium]